MWHDGVRGALGPLCAHRSDPSIEERTRGTFSACEAVPAPGQTLSTLKLDETPSIEGLVRCLDVREHHAGPLEFCRTCRDDPNGAPFRMIHGAAES